MASLTREQRDTISQLKKEIANNFMAASEIQDTTLVEDELLFAAISCLFTNKTVDYDDRMSELNKYRYIIDGILYNHLDSK